MDGLYWYFCCWRPSESYIWPERRLDGICKPPHLPSESAPKRLRYSWSSSFHALHSRSPSKSPLPSPKRFKRRLRSSIVGSAAEIPIPRPLLYSSTARRPSVLDVDDSTYHGTKGCAKSVWSAPRTGSYDEDGRTGNPHQTSVRSEIPFIIDISPAFQDKRLTASPPASLPTSNRRAIDND